MKYLGKIIDDKDLATKEYVDAGLNEKANINHTQTVSTISDLTATATELNYTDGVTSNIQTQLNTKAPIASPTFTGTVTGTQLISNVASGTPPLVITSSTVVPNLNADKLDGNDASAFALASHAHTVANINGLQTALDNKVDDSQVLTNVPANAKFTDTTYSEIPTAEIDAGTASTRRTITGRRIKYILDKVQAWLDNKVDKVSGKGLSSNDYTTAEKNKLAGIATGANNYTHPASHPASMITGLPTSLPADGGNADTVGGFSVGAATNNSVNSIVRTDNSGYLNCSWLRLTSGVLAGKPHGVWVENGNWLYYQTTDDFINNFDNATTSKAGLESAADKTKLDALPKIALSSTQPSSPTNGDYWYKIL